MTPPWIVRAWPPVVWPIHEVPTFRLVHLGTSVLHAPTHGGAGAGQTLWGGRMPQGSAGVAWDWVELSRGVVAMADPLGLISNLQFVDGGGAVLSGLQAALRLNQIVNLLPWQQEVARALEAEAGVVPALPGPA
jgi:hypothetical protein